MEQRELGGTGILLPVIGFGCGPNAELMVSDDRNTQRAVVARALQEGVTYFDTAADYGGGRSETNLGRVLHELGARPTISTKVILETEDYDDIEQAVLRGLCGSLRRLGLDSVDVVMLHNRVARDRSVPTVGSGATLDLDDVFGPHGVCAGFGELRRSGLAKAVGFTAYGGEAASVQELIASGQFDALNASYNVVNPSAAAPVGSSIEEDYARVILRAAEAGLGVMAIRVFSSGSVLQGGAARAAALGAIAAEVGESMAGLAVRYVLTTSAVTSAIVGFSEERHVDEAVRAAARGPLEDATIAQVNALALGA